jgi:carboxylesterase
LRGGPTACLLVHGFTAMPEEMRALGDDLHGLGHTVLCVRLAGHGTDPRDLARVRWNDWLVTIEDGLALLAAAEKVVLVGQSLGGVVVLTAAARYPVAGVVVLSTPFSFPRTRVLWPRLRRKDVAAHPELGPRREAEYPAYAAEHTRVYRELQRLSAALRDALAELDVPVLVIASRADPWVPVSDAEAIIARIGSPAKRLLLLDELGHSIALDPRRTQAVTAIHDFVAAL